MRKLNLLKISCLVISAFILISWGYQGHNKINYNSTLSFNEEMGDFISWASTLAAHASDADERKDIDPSEGPKHYIDIDNYPEFLMSGRIPSTLDSVAAKYGMNFVIDQGILPWATITAYDSLVECFRRYDWYHAVLFASDLGHYIADGHMPLHITRNYDGQYSGNDGIHSRYESSMVNAFINQFNYQGGSIEFIDNVNQYVFSYLYANYPYVDSVLIADVYARNLAGNTSSFAYKQALWDKTRNFTVPLFANASHALAEMIYSAWTEAGKPPFNSNSLDEEIFVNPASLQQNYPNPFSGSTSFTIYLAADSQISLKVMDMKGKAISILADGFMERGISKFDWNAEGCSPGIYFILLEKDGQPVSVKKAVVISSR